MEIEYKKHNEIYEKLQSEYLQKQFGERDNNLLGKMYQIAYEYACNVLINYTHKKGLHWKDWIIEDKAHAMAVWLTEPYLRKPEFKIDKLSSYGHFAKLKILYGDKEWETKTCSYESLIENGGEHYIDENGETFWDFGDEQGGR